MTHLGPLLQAEGANSNAGHGHAGILNGTRLSGDCGEQERPEGRLLPQPMVLPGLQVSPETPKFQFICEFYVCTVASFFFLNTLLLKQLVTVKAMSAVGHHQL